MEWFVRAVARGEAVEEQGPRLQAIHSFARGAATLALSIPTSLEILTMTQPAAPYAAPEPGKTLGIVALIAVFFISLLGLILGFVAQSQSKAAGVPNTPAKVAIILGIIFIVLQIVGGILGLLFFLPYAGVQIG